MKNKPQNLNERADATRLTIAKYSARAFNWNGSCCIHLVRTQAVNFGHKMPPMPTIKSAIGARGALKRMGFARNSELMDSLFTPINAAQMWTGDICMLRGDGEADDVLGALCISDGHGNLFGWHAADLQKLSVIKASAADILKAWRI